MTNNDTLKLKGKFFLQCIDKITGDVVHEYTDNNLIVDLGRHAAVLLLGGDPSASAATKIGVGTSNTAATNADTSLTGAFIKNLNTAGTVNAYTTNTVTFGYQVDTTEANGMTIWEFGLFTTSSVLIARKVLSSSIAKNNAFAIAGYWTLTIS